MPNKTYLILDFETDALDKNICSPIQIGAIAIDANKLEIIPNSEFYSWVQPDDVNDSDYYIKHKATLDWHCKNYNSSIDDFLVKLKNAPTEKIVFDNFTNYISKYHTKPNSQTIFSAPILAAYNGYNFDFPILDRLCKKYNKINKDGEQNLYFSRDTIDILKIVTLWFTPIDEVKSFSMDSIRDYLGLSKAGAHDALVDIRQEAMILIKFLSLHKRLATQIPFKNAFAKEEVLNV